MNGTAWFVFLAAAGIGAPARYLLDGWVQDHTSGVFPWGTLVVNVTGCFALGMLTGLGLSRELGETARTVIGTAGLGSYTTFSTFTFETVRLVEEGVLSEALLNVAANLFFGLAASFLGIALITLL